MKIEPRNTSITAFSLASLTDVVMLLLIFFLLSSSYIIQHGIPVLIPRSDNENAVVEKEIVVTIESDRTVWVGEVKTGLEGMASELRRLLIHGANQTVVINADKTVPLETLVEVIDRIKAAGGEKFLIATVREES